MAKRLPRESIAISEAFLEHRQPPDCLIWLRPEFKKSEAIDTHTWLTLCERYAIARVISHTVHDNYFVAMKIEQIEQFHGGLDNRAWEKSDKEPVFRRTLIPLEYQETGRPHTTRTLHRAIEMCVKHFCENYQVDGENSRLSYDNDILAHAVDEKISDLPREDEPKKLIIQGGIVVPRVRVAGAGTDKFGAREGTNNFKVNACMTTEWQTMKELAAKAGIEGTTYGYLNNLAKNGLIEKDGSKFRLKPSK